MSGCHFKDLLSKQIKSTTIEEIFRKHAMKYLNFIHKFSKKLYDFERKNER